MRLHFKVPEYQPKMHGIRAPGSPTMVKDTSDLEHHPSAESGERGIEPMSRNEGYPPTILPISPVQTGLGSVLENTPQDQPELFDRSPHRSDQNDSLLLKPTKRPNRTLSQVGMSPQQVRGSETAPPSTHDWVIGRQLGVIWCALIAEGGYGEVHSVLRPKPLANTSIDVGPIFSGIIRI